MNYYKQRFHYPLEGRRACGVYAIQHEGKDVYVGSSVDINWRLTGHVGDLRHGRHAQGGSKRLQKLWDDNTGQGFSFRVIELCPAEQRRSREAYWQHAIPGLLISLRTQFPASMAASLRRWPSAMPKNKFTK